MSEWGDDVTCATAQTSPLYGFFINGLSVFLFFGGGVISFYMTYTADRDLGEAVEMWKNDRAEMAEMASRKAMIDKKEAYAARAAHAAKSVAHTPVSIFKRKSASSSPATVTGKEADEDEGGGGVPRTRTSFFRPSTSTAVTMRRGRTAPPPIVKVASLSPLADRSWSRRGARGSPPGQKAPIGTLKAGRKQQQQEQQLLVAVVSPWARIICPRRRGGRLDLRLPGTRKCVKLMYIYIHIFELTLCLFVINIYLPGVVHCERVRTGVGVYV